METAAPLWLAPCEDWAAPSCGAERGAAKAAGRPCECCALCGAGEAWAAPSGRHNSRAGSEGALTAHLRTACRDRDASTDTRPEGNQRHQNPRPHPSPRHRQPQERQMQRLHAGQPHCDAGSSTAAGRQRQSMQCGCCGAAADDDSAFPADADVAGRTVLIIAPGSYGRRRLLHR
eukprot:360804-Chlamydomonas_euryale.AAC.5